MTRLLWILPLAGLFACGEAQEVILPQRPDRLLFTDIRESFITLGCSANGEGCHSVLVGDYRLGTSESGVAEIEEEFQLTKALVNLDSPPESLILRVALRNDPLALGHPICFDSETSCAFRRVVAWLSYEGQGDPTPDAVCDPSELIENACFSR